MCCIALCETVRPSSEMVKAMWEGNQHGGGVAWQEDGKVKWKKGIDTVEEMQYLAETLPFPFIQHFRIASVGGVCDELTHPFLVNNNASIELEGESESDYVLFHNGSWHEWKQFVLKASFDCKIALPDGKWSDSRAMAFLASIYGKNICEMINEKIVILSKDDVQIFWGSGWTEVEGVWCSNDFFKHKMRGKTPMCAYGKCQGYPVMNNIYCYQHKEQFAREAKEKEANGNVKDGVVVEGPPVNPSGGALMGMGAPSTTGLVRTTPIVARDAITIPGVTPRPNLTLLPGGAGSDIPFRVLMAAQHQAAKGLISNKEYKRIRKIFQRNPIELAQADMLSRLTPKN